MTTTTDSVTAPEFDFNALADSVAEDTEQSIRKSLGSIVNTLKPFASVANTAHTRRAIATRLEHVDALVQDVVEHGYTQEGRDAIHRREPLQLGAGSSNGTAQVNGSASSDSGVPPELDELVQLLHAPNVTELLQSLLRLYRPLKDVDATEVHARANVVTEVINGKRKVVDGNRMAVEDELETARNQAGDAQDKLQDATRTLALLQPIIDELDLVNTPPPARRKKVSDAVTTLKTPPAASTSSTTPPVTTDTEAIAAVKDIAPKLKLVGTGVRNKHGLNLKTLKPETVAVLEANGLSE